MLYGIMFSIIVGDAAYWAEDYGSAEVHHRDLLAYECTEPAPPRMRHLAYSCDLWRYDYGDDDDGPGVSGVF